MRFLHEEQTDPASQPSNQDIKDAMHNVELPSEYVEDSYEFVKIIKEEL